MNPEELCEKLKKYVSLFYGNKAVYARVMEDGMYTFGTRKPFTRNIVTKPVAIWIAIQKIELEEPIKRTK